MGTPYKARDANLRDRLRKKRLALFLGIVLSLAAMAGAFWLFLGESSPGIPASATTAAISALP